MKIFRMCLFWLFKCYLDILFFFFFSLNWSLVDGNRWTKTLFLVTIYFSFRSSHLLKIGGDADEKCKTKTIDVAMCDRLTGQHLDCLIYIKIKLFNCAINYFEHSCEYLYMYVVCLWVGMHRLKILGIGLSANVLFFIFKIYRWTARHNQTL